MCEHARTPSLSMFSFVLLYPFSRTRVREHTYFCVTCRLRTQWMCKTFVTLSPFLFLSSNAGCVREFPARTFFLRLRKTGFASIDGRYRCVRACLRVEPLLRVQLCACGYAFECVNARMMRGTCGDTYTVSSVIAQIPDGT